MRDALTIVICLVVMFMGAWMYHLGGNAMTIFGFGFALIGSLILVDTIVNFDMGHDYD